MGGLEAPPKGPAHDPFQGSNLSCSRQSVGPISHTKCAPTCRTPYSRSKERWTKLLLRRRCPVMGDACVCAGRPSLIRLCKTCYLYCPYHLEYYVGLLELPSRIPSHVSGFELSTWFLATAIGIAMTPTRTSARITESQKRAGFEGIPLFE